MKIIAKTSIQILCTVTDVFDAIISPEKMSQYFIERASAPMKSNSVVFWKFPEFDTEFPVTIIDIIPLQKISFSWNPAIPNGKVEIHLEEFLNTYTIVRIEEKEFETNEAGIKNALQQTEGWANFLACLKAFLEYNINLRKGAFDFMR